MHGLDHVDANGAPAGASSSPPPPPRVASSLKDRTTPAHVVLDRLAAGSPSDRLAKALTTLGRVVKTVSVLRYLHDGALRDRVHLQLNRGEYRHALTDRLFFGNQGEFRTDDREEMMNKVSALSLLSNAVLVWNSVRIAEIVGGLECSVARPVRPEILAPRLAAEARARNRQW